jgi:hypothetical protein
MSQAKFDYEQYTAKMSNDASIQKIIFDESSNVRNGYLAFGTVPFDRIYATQHQIALSWFVDIHHHSGFPFPGREAPGVYACLDVGSQFNFILTLSTFANFIMTEPILNFEGSNAIIPDLGVLFLDQEAQNISRIGSGDMRLVTSLHAIEHFGLGRYGDTIDPLGDIRGLKEFNRVLSQNGDFIGSVPIDLAGRERVDFNRNRIYSIDLVRKMLKESGFIVLQDCVATACPGFAKKTVNNEVAEETYPASWVFAEEFEESMKQLEKNNPEIVDQHFDSAYVWLAKKERSVSDD